MSTSPTTLAAHDRDSLEQWMHARGEPRSHAGRVLRAFYGGCGELDWDALELSAGLRETLRHEFAARATHELRRVAAADGTTKLLLGLARGGAVETVMMPSYRAGEAWCCVSSQVGCAMGCDFCASTRGGLERNLEVDEIVEQYLRVGALAAAQGRRVRRLVFMGMGEPLHNFENVKAALELLQSEEGPNFSSRHITVSTVGLVPMIERFAQETEVKLAISLNASSDETRDRIMPVNKRWKIAELMEAVKRFPVKQGRRVTFEYVLMSGVNDTDEDAQRLATLLEGVPAKVNLIQYNENPGLGFNTTADNRAERFRALLEKANVAAFIRANRGRDIAAACGQLANVDTRAEGR